MYFFAGLFFAAKILSSGCCCSNFYSTKVCSIFCSLMTLSLESCRAPKQLFDDALLLWKKQSVFHLPHICHHVELSRTSSTTTSTSTSTLQQQLTSITQLLKHSSSTFFFWKDFSNCATNEFYFFFFFLSSIWLCLLIFVLVTIQCQILDQFDFKNKKSNFFAQIWFKVEGL